ncbi:MAG: hypothetical protein ACI841_000681 [Planctomycetota bacterium]|jgi:hypothetical protein
MIASTLPRALVAASLLGLVLEVRAGESELTESKPVDALGAKTTLPATKPLEFSRDVRPILSDRCFQCHGNDAPARRAGLRLDTSQGATAELASGNTAVVSGDVDRSALVHRIESSDPDQRMPPADSGKDLNEDEIALLRQWIEEGAEWTGHWSFRSPVMTAAPSNRDDATWSLDPIDDYIARKRDGAGLAASPQAERESLLRRMTLDLTGLAPTIEELDAFLADTTDKAYERAVDRLLASPRYGEHMTRFWLDAARYADTHGLHLDNERSMWPWRQWVIEAFNQNKSFDEFTVEQLAGDLLPDATLEQRIASGFNRNNPTSAEGGMIAEEYFSLYAKDRVETTSTVFLGLTMGCASCHDHKFDPLTMRDFYSLYAFFNNLTEEASDRNIENPVPFLKTPTEEQRTTLASMRENVQTLQASLTAPMPEADEAQVVWESDWRDKLANRWQAVTPNKASAKNGSTLTVEDSGEVAVSGTEPDKEVFTVDVWIPGGGYTAVRIDALCDERFSTKLPGRADNNNFVLSEIELSIAPASSAENVGPKFERIHLGAADASFSQQSWPIEAVLDGNPNTGWGGLGLDGARHAVVMASQSFGHKGGSLLRMNMRFESIHKKHDIGRFALSLSKDTELLTTHADSWWASSLFKSSDGQASLRDTFAPETSIDLIAKDADGGALWTKKSEYVDGKVHLFDQAIGARYLWRTIHSSREQSIVVGLGSDDGIRAWLNGEQVHDNPGARGVAVDQDEVRLHLREGPNELLLKIANYGGGFGFAFRIKDQDQNRLPIAIGELLSRSHEDIDPEQKVTLRDHYRSLHDPVWARLNDQMKAENAAITTFEAELPTTLVSEERKERRPAHILIRGQYDTPGDEVQPATPAVLPGMPEDAPRNRLGLARWLVSPDNPLMSRVTVNRFWQQLFGIGLVETSEDFGSQGDWPSHPELLDRLALDFIESGWDVKALMKRLVMTRTYRQSSRMTPELLEIDPHNRLLARGVRHRLAGEVLRDQALQVSGLLVEQIGGPSVRPYQPPGVWFAVGYTRSNTARFTQGSGDELYRRSLYSFWKRTAPPPSMATFDAPSREACRVRRDRTNTPLQALVMMNDVQYVEAARHFAARILREGGATTRSRLTWGFRSLTSRHPDETELAHLHLELGELSKEFAADRDAARELLEVGDSADDTGIDAGRLAAWTCIASLLMNLDEALSKP